MRTYSHFIMTAALGKRLKGETLGGVPLRTGAFLLGSILPDGPLALLTLGYFAYRRWINPALLDEFVYGPTYDALYFTNPVWIIGYNSLHAPLMIALYALAGWFLWKRGRGWGAALLWFALGCALHSFVDILTHHNDGPLLLFPFHWSLRFHSPISYWDPRHHGAIVGALEHAMDLALLAYLALPWLWKRLRPAR